MDNTASKSGITIIITADFVTISAVLARAFSPLSRQISDTS